MIQKTEAIVLKATKFRDTSLITTFLTEDFGKIKALSKGVRKEQSPVISHYEPFSQIQIVFYEKTRSDIHFVSESSMVYYFAKLRGALDKIGWASYLMELTDLIVPLHENDPEIFHLLVGSLRAMESGDAAHAAAVYAVKLLRESGFFPNLEGCLRCGKACDQGYLSFPEGGLFCPGCRGESANDFPLSRALLRNLRFFSENELAYCLESGPAGEGEEDLHRWIHLWARYRFDRDLVTVQFLKQVRLFQST